MTAADVALARDEAAVTLARDVAAQRDQVGALTAAVIAGTTPKLQPADRHEWLKAIDPDYAAGQAAEVTR